MYDFNFYGKTKSDGLSGLVSPDCIDAIIYVRRVGEDLYEDEDLNLYRTEFFEWIKDSEWIIDA